MKELLKKIGTEIKQNYPQLILAFVLAMGAWLLVSVQVFPTIEQKVNSVPIEAKLTDLMLQNNLQIVSNTDSVVDIRIEGKRYDMGNKLGIMKANCEFALDHDEIGADFREYIKELAKTL